MSEQSTTVRWTQDTEAARVWPTEAAAHAAARELAPALGAGVNRLGESGRGLLAVGYITEGEYVVFHTALGWVAADPPMAAPDGSKSVGVDCCPDQSFATAAEADAHEAACPRATARP